MEQDWNSDKLGIYIHIPFCQKKCSYCDFYSIENQEQRKRYLHALIEEIVLVADRLGKHNSADTIYFGGGTPSILSPSEIDVILETLNDKFAIDENAEISIECNPGTITIDKLRSYKKVGVNRVSLGIQSFFDDELKFLSRIHTAEEGRSAITSSQKAGFENINIDLIYALPDQTFQRLERNLYEALSFKPEHISAYTLIVEPGTSLYNSVNNGYIKTIDPVAESEMYEFVMDMLEAYGYHHYEVSNYCRPGFKCRHNLKYWTGNEYLGFGASAHSYFGNTRSWNVSSVKSYISAIEKLKLPISASEILTSKEQAEEYIMLSLRSGRLDLTKLLSQFYIYYDLDFINDLVHSGYAINENGILKLTKKGFTVCDEIAQAFVP
ncbi:MAG: radical SAM family heme chaperone HemW [Candidatus Kryptoniota bacterium]